MSDLHFGQHHLHSNWCGERQPSAECLLRWPNPSATSFANGPGQDCRPPAPAAGKEADREGFPIQLSRGEGQHAVARAVFHGKKGKLRQRYREGMEDRLGALGLVVNALVPWNTRCLQQALAQHQAVAEPPEPGDVGRAVPSFSGCGVIFCYFLVTRVQKRLGPHYPAHSLRVSFFYGMEPLLQPRHPLEKYHRAQLDFLAALPEEARAEHARLFRLGNATYRYQQQAHGAVTEADFHHWLEGLPEKTRAVMEREGVEASQNSWPLRRHALERRDLGQEAFLQAILSPEDWACQQQAARAPTPESEGK